MTWRLDGLTRRAWLEPGRGAARCAQCGWGFSRKSPVRANRMARAHTRDTGHATRTAQVKVTEYRKAG